MFGWERKSYMESMLVRGREEVWLEKYTPRTMGKP
jgi:hypothetical protein